jgi:ESSS subunit of NADH:ubiquinone oxidoreductase (complex I)
MFSAAVARSTVARRVATTTAKSSSSHPRPGGARVLQQQQQQQQHQRRMGSDMPVPQSQNAPLWHGHSVKKEGWEEYMYFYYAAGMVLQAAVLLATPETSIESWARAEAKARLYLASSKGQTEFEFGKHYQDVVEAENLELWSRFAAKAVTPGDDDDDDEEEEEEEVRICKNVLLYPC